MRWRDTSTGYGWISIILHWATAVAVLVMLLVGNSIPAGAGYHPDTLALHTSLAFVFYLALWFRIGWRLRQGHPGPLPRQKGLFFQIGKLTHWTLLAALAGMLLSGPAAAWSGGYPVQVFGLFAIPSPLAPDATLFALARSAHIGCATVLGLGALLHVAGAAKHFIINRDGTLDKILVPAGPQPAATRPSERLS
jgi:cytochrome b561